MPRYRVTFAGNVVHDAPIPSTEEQALERSACSSSNLLAPSIAMAIVTFNQLKHIAAEDGDIFFVTKKINEQTERYRVEGDTIVLA